MTNKNPVNLRDVHRKSWTQPPQPENCSIALKPNEDIDVQRTAANLWRETAASYDTLLWPPALRQLLESDHYHVAFLPRVDRNGPFGADPYFTDGPAGLLPFSWKELIARVYESVRRLYSVSGEPVTGFADVCVNFDKMEVSRAGKPVKLTAQEFKTLKFLMQNAERVISRDELLNEAWGYQNYPSTRTVDNHILKLRQKLERDPARPTHFLTIPRAGYKFVP
jgi:hypothetical protein